jgi:cytochrome c1
VQHHWGDVWADLVPSLWLIQRRPASIMADGYKKNMMQVCAACHSVQQLHFRNLVDVAYTEEEAKSMAADIEVTPDVAIPNIP